MLALKLLLVPAFLLLLSLAGRRWGPSVAGWLAGLPVVAGPILFFLAVERGEAFASNASSASLSAVFASVSFSVAYSHASQRMSWVSSLLLALPAWATAAYILSLLASSATTSLLISLVTLLAAPGLFPATQVQSSTHIASPAELFWRMLAGAALTVAVTVAAGSLGSGWSGLLAVFPVLGIVLAVFSHRTEGPAYVAALLRAMARGLYSLCAFCLTLAFALPTLGSAGTFAVAAALAITVQGATKRHLTTPSSGLPVAAARVKRCVSSVLLRR